MGAWIETLSAGVKFTADTSHPTWVRGLKHVMHLLSNRKKLSHPTWVRGLKLTSTILPLVPIVAPYVGAWIETQTSLNKTIEGCVAPYVGAWIETNSTLSPLVADNGRTLRGCVD